MTDNLSDVRAAVAAHRSLWIELELAAGEDLHPGLHGLRPVDDPPHCTLLFLGKGRSPAFVDLAHDCVRRLSLQWGPVESRASGLARFVGSEAEGDPVVLLLSQPKIRRMRRDLELQLAAPDSDWDYTPHVTLGRVSRELTYPAGKSTRRSLLFPSVALCAGESRVSWPLSGAS